MELDSLGLLMEDPAYSELKTSFIKRRADFWQNADAIKDLDAYTRGDNDHEYKVLWVFLTLDAEIDILWVLDGSRHERKA